MAGKERTRLKDNSCFNLGTVQDLEGQEGQILEIIHSSLEPIQYVRELAVKHTSTLELHDREDEQACKTIMVALKHFEMDSELMLALISMVIAHFADPRESFVDRACFLATSLYKKDEFGAQTRKTFKTFETFLPKMSARESTCSKHKGGFNEIHNPSVSSSPSSYDGPAGCFYDDLRNPVFLQKALGILKSSSNTNQLKAVHFHFKRILDRTTPRTFRLYSNEVFDQLLDLSNSRTYDEQFKSLAHMISMDVSIFDKALDRFKNTSLSTMRTYLLYAFDMVHDLVGLDLRISIHLKFTEMIINTDMELDEISRTQVMLFVKRGMALLRDTE